MRRACGGSCCAAARSTWISWRASAGSPSANVAICRVEQLAPFPRVALGEALDSYPSLEEVVWLQEEPENMGAWDWVRGQLEETIAERFSLRFIGRVRSASPSEGSAAWHQINQRKLVDEAFTLDGRGVAVESTILSKAVRSLTASKR